jgi:hypothetical protein
MKSTGRPTSYTPDHARQAELICRLGATDAQLAGIFAVHPETLRRWRARYPAFAEAVRAGRAMADLRVTMGLYQNAVGYDQKVTRVSLHRGKPVSIEITRHQHARVGAALQWLRVRDPAWRMPHRRRDDGTDC